MYRLHRTLKNGRPAQAAWSHSSYIKSNFKEVWSAASERAAILGISLSEYNARVLFTHMTGQPPAGVGRDMRDIKLPTKKGR